MPRQRQAGKVMLAVWITELQMKHIKKLTRATKSKSRSEVIRKILFGVEPSGPVNGSD